MFAVQSISSAPGIFHRTMGTLLQEIQSVLVYIDDILVTGMSVEVNLETLNETLHCLKKAGLYLKKSKCHSLLLSVVF